MPSAQDPLFSLRIGPFSADEFTVTSFEGREEMSRLYRFDIALLTPIAPAILDGELAGAAAEFRFEIPGSAPRSISGIVAKIERFGTRDEAGRWRASVRLVPKLWKLRKRRNTRIYQDQSVIDVVSRVLEEHGIAREWRTTRAYPPRAYAVQHEETDLAFVTRLLAEDGLFFHFEAPGAESADPAEDERDRSDRLILGDNVDAYGFIAGAPSAASGERAPAVVPFRPAEGMRAEDESVTRFGARRAVKSTSLRHHDYDFERPLLGLLVATKPQPGVEAALGGLDVFEHHGDHSNVDDAQDRAEVSLEQIRRGAFVASGEGTCRRFAAGHRFVLEGHVEPSLDGDWLITRVEHRGVSPAFARSGAEPDVYRSKIACVPATLVYRARPPRRKLIHALASAIVVGPKSEAIHTDAYGRVKVQFHWDREGQHDDRSSCWLRVSQAWSGSAWGFQFIPRVGMEVIVSFLGGDPDRPVVVGTLYNRLHMPPFPLPFDKTRSGIRTNSVGGTGYNELSFEDEGGGEQVRLHAARNLDVEVERDHTRIVRGDEAASVGGMRRDEIGQDFDLTVRGRRAAFVGEDDALFIQGRATVRRGDTGIDTAGTYRHTVAGASTTRVEGPMRVEAESLTTSVEGDHRLAVGAEGADASSHTFVFGDLSLAAKGTLTLRADEGIVLACGTSTLRLGPETLDLLTKTARLVATESALLMGAKQTLQLGEGVEICADTVTVLSAGASLELTDAEARLGGSKVKLGKAASAPAKDQGKDPDPDKKRVRWRFTDSAKQPYANKKFHVLVEGLRIEGQTDGDGALVAEIPKRACGAEVLLWLEDYPTGPRRRYPMVIVDALPDVMSAQGARVRLHALGYDIGLHSADPWRAMRAAVHLFQTRHATSDSLEATGELDDPTMAAIGRAFGG